MGRGIEMRACWAACLGACSDKITREHIFTEGLFLDDAVKVKGFSWCLDDFKTVGLAALVKKVLCAAHNSMLSEVDNAAIGLMKALRAAVELNNARALLEPQNWQVQKFPVDGSKLERWFLKTFITFAFGAQPLIGIDSSQPGHPSRALVETAFGLRQFPPRAGLHLLGDAGEQIQSEEGIVMTTFSGQTGRLAGARFWFRGFEFLLLLDEPQPGPFTFTSQDDKHKRQPTARYHSPGIGFTMHDRLSHLVEFVWMSA
jgi:hypothetical protein